MDKYPFPDYDIDTHFIVSNNRIVKMSARHLKDAMVKRYDPIKKKMYIQFPIQTMRGCPYNCTYCGNNSLKKINNKESYFVRKRSIRNVLDELEGIKKRFKFIGTIEILDDTFFARTKKDIEEFCNEYKKRINLPLEVFISPQDANEDKIKILAEAGLYRVSVGVQSACDQTLIHIYKRPMTKNKVLKSIHILNKCKSKITPLYDFILDNPYEDKKSLKETVELVARIPQESEIRLFALNLFPGTELYERAKKDGIIKDEIRDVYLKGQKPGDVQRLDLLVIILLLYQWCLTKGERFLIKSFLRNLLKLLVHSKIIFLIDNRFVVTLFLWLRKIKHRLKFTKD